MKKPKSIFRLFSDTGLLTALAVAVALLVGIAGPASAQFFNFGGWSRPAQPSAPRSGGWFGGDFFAPFRQEQPKQRVYQDFSKPPPPEKRETVAERNVLVLGDAMAEWLAYGLEDAYAEQPDMGVIRKAKTVSGLIKYQPKGDPADWVAAAKAILATEKPDAIVVMLGLNDRVAIRDQAADKPDKPADKKTDKKKDARGNKPADAKDDTKGKPDGAADTAAKGDDKTVDNEVPQDEADNDAPVTAPARTARSPNGLYEFRDDHWVELYSKKIEDMIAVLKTKGVPVLWVGLPAIRGPKATADALFLDSLYRDEAGKAGITYVDVWDGFVDEAGRFLQKGPDFEGQIRQLRSYDGVYFTRPGARKLAHYVEREINRLLAARSGPIALPTEPATPDTNAQPGQPAPRPLAGPILPLVASSVSSDQLLGGPGSRPAPVDALAARTLVKGEALAAPPGRADDFAWPHREVGHEQAKGDVPVASTSPTASPEQIATAPGAPPKPARRPPQLVQPQFIQPQPVQQQPHTPGLRELFGFGSAPRQPQPPPRGPRPPANVGPSAWVPGFFTR